MKKLAARIIINDLIKYAEPVFELCKANTVNIGLKKIEILAMKTLLEELDNSISKDKIKEIIEEQTKRIDELLDGMIDKSIGCINTSLLSKKEKEEVINKRNCLLVQKATLQQMCEELLKGE